MPLGKLGFAWDGLGSIVKLVKQWNPGELKTEGEYEKSLYKFLCDNTSGLEVTRQFGSSRLRVDIAVERSVFIELKKNLHTTSQLQRLLGQLRLYKKEGWEKLILVLAGDVDPGLLKQAEDGLKDAFSGFDVLQSWDIVRK